MKIAHILQTSLDSGQGGIGTYLKEVVPRQIKLGYDVKVITNKRYKQFGDYSIPMNDFNFLKDKKFEALFHSFNVNLQLFFSDFDILHYHFVPSGFFCFIPTLRNKKKVLTVHGMTEDARELSKSTKMVLNLVYNSVLSNVNKITTVTPYLQKKLYNKFGVDSEYYPHGFSEGKSLEAKLITEKFGLKKDDYFLSLGRLTQSKGFDTIIKAYQNFKSKKKLVIAGSYEINYLNYLQSLIKPEFKENIIFTDSVEGKVKDELYSNAFLYISGIETKGLSLTNLEAIAHKIPVISSNVEGANHLINELTYRFKTQDSEDLSRILFDLEFNDYNNKRLKFINSAYNVGKNNYSWDLISKNFISIYENLNNK